jgi:RNA polymerase sigma factor (sigma-70 family)
VRDSIALMLGLEGYRTSVFSDAEAFLAAWREDWAGCVIADVRLPGQSGVELQDALRKREIRLPFVLITAHGDVATARAAFRSQAVDFLEKPFDSVQLFAAIETAFALEERRIQTDDSRRRDSAKLQRLTAREREVLEQAAQGLHAKEIAAALGISPRTVEVHKTRIMEKLGVRNVAELVRFTLAAIPPERN